MKSIYKLTLFLLLIPSITFGINGDKKKHEKSRNIRKSFDVNSNATLNIMNKYGDVNVTTWSQNRIEIEVNITVKGDDLDEIEERLENIDIEFSSSASLVEAKTMLGSRKNSWSFWRKSKRISYEIDYTVKMPVTNNAKLNNDYGSISLDKLEGEATINCDYGKITIGDLMGTHSDINLDYCSNSTIDSMKDGNVNIDYSRLMIESAIDVDLNADYSTFKSKDLSTLSFNTDYGSLEIENVDKVRGGGDYTGLRFGTLTGSLKVESDYGSIKIRDLAKGFDYVDIESEYAGIRIGTDSANNFDFVIELQYAGFKRDDDNIELYKSIVKSTKKYYEGTFGKGNSNSKVTIRSSYGSVSIQEN